MLIINRYMTSKQENKVVGNMGENIANAYLQKNGYVVLDRNWRCGNYEIDIICIDNKQIVFVEVKTHNYNPCFDLAKMVNKQKRRRIIFSANKYIRYNRICMNARFDVVEVVLNGGEFFSLNHVKNAFYSV